MLGCHVKGRLPKLCVAQLGLWQLRCDGDFLHVWKLHVRSRLVVTYEFPYLLVLDKKESNTMYVTEGFAAKLRSTHVIFQRVEEHLKD